MVDAKILKYRYNKSSVAYRYISRDEWRAGAGNFAYLSITPDGLTLSGGAPSRIIFNTLSPIYGSIVRDTPFPLTLLPSALAPPKQIPAIPLASLLPEIQSLAQAAQVFLV